MIALLFFAFLLIGVLLTKPHNTKRVVRTHHSKTYNRNRIGQFAHKNHIRVFKPTRLVLSSPDHWRAI